MQKIISITIFCLWSLSLWGCTYYPPPPQTITTPSREVFTITQRDMGGTDLRNHYLNVRTNQFRAGETPCVLVKGYSGETVTVDLYNLDTGKLRAQNTVSAPQSQIPYLCYPSLGNGSFKVDVFLHGVLSGTTTFGVSR
ncbi:hypothetical protein ACFLZQ_03815 [Thermodesulfobacteriota bacterium]